MKLILAIFSGLAMVTGTLAVGNALGFTTWLYNNYASPTDAVSGPCNGIDYQNRSDDVSCYNEHFTGQGSLIANFAKDGCQRWFGSCLTSFYKTVDSEIAGKKVSLYSETNCAGTADRIFGFEISARNCKPIEASAHILHNIIC